MFKAPNDLSLSTAPASFTQSQPVMRSLGLDYIRACAILMVIAYHSVQMSPLPLTGILPITTYGQYGVDLFFVLSGWLIGGLYWREYDRFGRVEIARFWARRWLRTLPPYFVMLIASWVAVRWTRTAEFDLRYLVFAQNYYPQIPYFLVSWSLCVEEHFYVIAPIITAAIVRLVRGRYWIICWAVTIGLSPLLRLVEFPKITLDAFGYSTTATHLRLDGLALGFGASYLAVTSPTVTRWMRRHILVSLVIAVLALGAVRIFGGIANYVLWPLLLALAFTVIVFATSASTRFRQKQSWLSGAVQRIAIASYSAYLVHPLCIHMARSVAARASSADGIVYWVVVPLLITSASAGFYVLFEKAAIYLRDRLVPSAENFSPTETTVLPATSGGSRI